MIRYASKLSKFTRKEINQMFKSTVMRFKQGGIDIRFALSKKDFGRLLIIIPKRFGNAPLRNRLRRRLKSLFYEKRWHEKKVDLIITAYPEAIQLSFQELTHILQVAFETFHRKFPHPDHTNFTTGNGNL